MRFGSQALNLSLLRRIASALLLPICIVGVWQASVTVHPALQGTFSSPLEVIRILSADIANGTVVGDLAVSLREAGVGWFVALIVGGGLGVACAWITPLRLVVVPILELVRPISPIAWIPVVILWLGIGFSSIVAIIIVISFFIVFLNAYDGAHDLSTGVLSAGRTLCVKPFQFGLHVAMPGSMRGILRGAQYALTAAWGGMVVAELVGSTGGIGHRMLIYGNSLRPDGVIANMVIVAVVGFALNALFELLLHTRIGRYVR